MVLAIVSFSSIQATEESLMDFINKYVKPNTNALLLHLAITTVGMAVLTFFPYGGLLSDWCVRSINGFLVVVALIVYFNFGYHLNRTTGSSYLSAVVIPIIYFPLALLSFYDVVSYFSFILNPFLVSSLLSVFSEYGSDLSPASTMLLICAAALLPYFAISEGVKYGKSTNSAQFH